MLYGMRKIIVIAGPTSSGKTGLAVELARKVGGEVVSADSRQVYRGLNLGTGKATKREMQGVPHHMLSVADPRHPYSASLFVSDARKAAEDIASRGKIPVVAGGTGFYIDAMLGLIPLTEVPPDKKLRASLSKFSLEKLQARLKKLDPKRYAEIDRNNPVRLIRAIEIASALGRVPKTKPKEIYDALYIGLHVPHDELAKKIRARLKARMRAGMLNEAKRLHAAGLSYKRMNELGLEYRHMALHLQGKTTRTEMLANLEKDIIAYAKRQMTWFKKNKSIVWLKPIEIGKVTALTERHLGLRKKGV